jgi:hypothetical protein
MKNVLCHFTKYRENWKVTSICAVTGIVIGVCICMGAGFTLKSVEGVATIIASSALLGGVGATIFSAKEPLQPNITPEKSPETMNKKELRQLCAELTKQLENAQQDKDRLEKQFNTQRDRLLKKIEESIPKKHIWSAFEVVKKEVIPHVKAINKNPYDKVAWNSWLIGVKNVFCYTIGCLSTEVHATLKFVEDLPTDMTGKKVDTYCRTFLQRRPEGGEHWLVRNTGFCSVIGNLGVWHSKPVKAFSCKDLTKYYLENSYHTTRTDFSDHYRVTFLLAFQHANSGFPFAFLTFDTKNKDLFNYLPEIYDYKNSIEEYNDLLDNHLTYRLIDLLADNVSELFAKAVEEEQRKVA